MRGRKPVPTALKIVRGNPGRRKLPTDEPRPNPSIPDCPDELAPVAKTEWKRAAVQLSALGVMTLLDRAVLAAYCQSYARWIEAEQHLTREGSTLESEQGTVYQSPWVSIAHKRLELVLKAGGELGLSPVTRTRIKATPPEKKAPAGKSRFFAS